MIFTAKFKHNIYENMVFKSLALELWTNYSHLSASVTKCINKCKNCEDNGRLWKSYGLLSIAWFISFLLAHN